MAIVFAARGNSFDARYSSGGKTAFKMNPSQVTTASAGLSGTVYDLTSAQNKFVSWTAYKNTPNSRVISVLMRVKVNYSGTPGANEAYWSMGSGYCSASNIFPFHECRHLTSGSLTMLGKNESAATTTNHGAAWSPTSGTFYDIFWKWDGTTGSNASKLYVDATLLSQSTPAAALTSSWDNTYFHSIVAGATPNVGACNMYMDELVIWDSLEDPTSVGLVGGTGSLNGASRTALVDVVSFDGQSNSAPSQDDVRNGTAFTVAGTGYTGNMVEPTAAQTKTGVAFGSSSSLTGTYDGSDRWSDPGENKVLSGEAYKANSLTNNKTGTLVSASAAQIWDYLTSSISTAGSIGKLLKDNVDTTISSRSTLTAANVWDRLTTALTTVNSVGKLIVDNVDATISSRLASGGYTAPDNTSITAIKAKTDNLPSDPADASDVAAAFSTVESAIIAVGTDVTAVKTKTDNLPSDPADQSAVEAKIDAAEDDIIAAIGTGGTPTSIADAVWNALTEDHVTPGSFATLVKKMKTFILKLQ